MVVSDVPLFRSCFQMNRLCSDTEHIFSSERQPITTLHLILFIFLRKICWQNIFETETGTKFAKRLQLSFVPTMDKFGLDLLRLSVGGDTESGVLGSRANAVIVLIHWRLLKGKTSFLLRLSYLLQILRLCRGFPMCRHGGYLLCGQRHLTTYGGTATRFVIQQTLFLVIFFYIHRFRYS